MSKKLIIGLLTLVFLTACLNDEPVEEVDANTEATDTQEELDEQLQEEAIQASFVEMNLGDVEENTKVFAEGEIGLLHGEDDVITEFNLSNETEDGVELFYVVFPSADSFSYEEGDSVKVYGVFNGESEFGYPEILATIVE